MIPVNMALKSPAIKKKDNEPIKLDFYTAKETINLRQEKVF